MKKENIANKIESIFDRAKHDALSLLSEIEPEPVPIILGDKTEGYVTIDIAAKHIDVSDRTLRQWVADRYRNIPARYFGRNLRFKLSELDEWGLRNARLRAVNE